jgi:glucoamylase
VRIARAALVCAVVLAAGVLLVSGGSDGDPRTPPALPGLPPPFLGTAVTGNGGLAAAIDAYGDVADLRAPGPAGAALIDNSAARQAAGTVPADTGIVPRVRIGGGAAVPMWRADSVTQRFVPGTNVVRTVARLPHSRVAITVAADGQTLAVAIRARSSAGVSVTPGVSINVTAGLRCARERRAGQLHQLFGGGGAVPPVHGAAAVIRSTATESRRWLARSRELDAGAPAWAQRMYERSLLTIHALASKRTGAVAAGARDGWAYVWPRDAATAALALEASGHRAEARSVARFLTGLDLGAAARFTEAGAPVPGRSAQGDASGWVAIAAEATGLPTPKRLPWRDRSDYQESSPGTYLGNALAAASVTPPPGHRVDGPETQPRLEFSARQHRAVEEGRRIGGEFGAEGGLVRVAGDPGSGLDSAAGWAVRPFGLRALYPAGERTLLRLGRAGTPYGITPGEGWGGGEDPWTAPTAWSAWALAGLAAERGGADRRSVADRQSALKLLGDLRRASTPAGDLPERVGVHTGIPTSTTPLLWSSAFAVLALRELWP